MKVRHVLAIARIDLLDLTRVRSTWIALLIFPIVNVMLIVVLPGVLTQREQHKQATATFDVAVEGATADIDALRDALADRTVRLTAATSARRSVLDRNAALGLVVAPGSAEALAGDQQMQLRAYVVGTRNESRQAITRVVADIERARTRIALERVDARDLQPSVVRPIVSRPVDLADTERGARLDLATVLPLLLLLPLSGAIGMSGQRVSGAKDARVLEPLLLLPLPRSTLLAGKAVAGYTLSCITVPAVALPLALGRIIPIGGTGRHIALPITALAAVVGFALVLVALLVAIGVCAGAASRTSAELGSILPFVSFPVILLALSMQVFGDVEATVPLLAVPILGPVLAARDVVGGVGTGSAALVAVTATLVWTALLLRGAARFLARDSSVIRASAA